MTGITFDREPAPGRDGRHGRWNFSSGPAVPDVYQSSGRTRAWGELEGWRLIAALAIVALHVWQHGWGLNPGFRPPAPRLFPFIQSLDLFVDFFFVVSGLVLAYPYLKALVDDPHGARVAGLRGFMVQRFLRVAPVYYAVLLVVWSTRNFGAATADWADLVEHLTFTQWLDPERIFYSIGPAWTVAVEFWMYPLVPLLFFGPRRFACRVASRDRRAWLGAIIPLAMIVISTAFKGLGKAVWDVPHTSHAFWYSLPSKLDDFAVGLLLALVVAWAGDRRIGVGAARICRLGGLAVLVFIGARRYDGSAVQYFLKFDNFEVYCHFLASIGFAVLVVPSLLAERRDRLNRVVGAAPAVAAGGFTYAIYLLHEPLLQPLTSLGILGTGLNDMARNWLTVLPISLVLAILLYVAIEWPMLRIRASVDRRTGRQREYYPELSDVGVGPEGPVRDAAGAATNAT